MAEDKKIYGQAWIYKDVVTTHEEFENKGGKLEKEVYTVNRESLVQEVITIPANSSDTYSTNVYLITNIWTVLGTGADETLTNSELTKDTNFSVVVKNKNNKYFYWEYSLTNTDDNVVTVNFECPKPTYDNFVSMGVLTAADLKKSQSELITTMTTKANSYTNPTGYEAYIQYWLNYYITVENNIKENEGLYKQSSTYTYNRVSDWNPGNTTAGNREDKTVTINKGDLSDLSDLISMF